MTNPNDSMYPHWDDADHFVPGLTKREHFAALNHAALLAKMAFDQPTEDMLHKAGIRTEDFEAYAAHLAVSNADALLAALNAEAKP